MNEKQPDQPVEKQLEQILAETESAIRRLREELQLREEHRRQHEAIERLPEYLEQTTLRLSKVREYFDDLLSELHRERSTDDPDAAEEEKD